MGAKRKDRFISPGALIIGLLVCLPLSGSLFSQNLPSISSSGECHANGAARELHLQRVDPGDLYREIAAYQCMLVLEDTSAQMDFAAAHRILERHAGGDASTSGADSGVFIPSDDSPPPAPGQSPSAFWVRIAVRDAGSVEPWYLAIERARLAHADLYTRAKNGEVQIQYGGDQVAPARQPYMYRYPVFPLAPPADQTTVYYLRVYSPQAFVTLPLVIRTPDRQRAAELYETIVLGAYFGTVAVMFAYNVILFISLRIRTYLYYVLYLASFAAAILVYQGVFPFLLSPELFEAIQPYNGRVMLLTVHIAAIFGVLFVRAFLRTDQIDALDRIGSYVSNFLLLLLAVHFIQPLIALLHRPMFIFFFVGLPLLGIIAGVDRMLRRKMVGSYFLIAWGVVLVALTGLFLEHHGFIPYGTFGRQGILVGSAIEMTLLSIGLADHFRRIEVEGERARAASRAKTSFLANMSHEIRTPLNAILGMSDLLTEANLKETERGYVNVLRRAGQGLLSLINDILDLSKIEAGKLAMERTAFDLHELVQNTAEILAPAARDRGIPFEWRIAPSIARRVVGDPLRLRQVLLNLMSNAVKFTTEGGVRIEVLQRSEKADRIRFHVYDTGIGIEENKLKHIFDSFAQADESTTRRHGGTGLGLTISRSLVELMGGNIYVRSVLGKGSDFYFDIPLPPDMNPVPAPELAGEALTHAASLRSLRILLAEDNADNQLLFHALLQKFPHKITVAENGAMAVQMARTESFDLIFMDIQMPEMDGLEATRRIREFQKKGGRIPIYALSAHAMQEDTVRSLAAGCDGHLTKPIRRTQLLEVIAGVANKPVPGSTSNAKSI